MNIKSLPHHLRPREKLIAKGAENLKDAELLAVLLRTGKAGTNVVQLATDILKEYSLSRLFQMSISELKSINAIDTAKATTLVAAFELVSRALDIIDVTNPIISAPSDVLPHLQSIRSRKKEHFVALYLNARNALLHQEIISVGTLNASIVHPREVFEPAVRVCAGSVLIAHNHPSGDTTPSDQDIRITKQLRQAGELLNIEIVDHIIVADRSYISMKEQGYL